MEDIFQVQGQVTKIISMSHRSARIQVDTQEGLTDFDLASLMALHEKVGHFVFAVEKPIEAETLLNLPPLVVEKDEKSPGTRLRNVLYIRWEQLGKPMESFELYYRSIMEKIIDQFKEKLN